jgi:hypothetical protein
MPNIKEKRFYTVEIECLIPATVKYKVLMEDGEYQKAVLETVKLSPIDRPKLRLNLMRRIKATVYDLGTNMIRHIHRF